MTIKKHGVGDGVITERDDNNTEVKKTALPDWTEEDRRELDEELKEDADSSRD